jgi:oligopeptide transport system ATP-binding protein
MVDDSAKADGRPMLEVRDLTTRFVTQDAIVHAVNNVSFEVRRGECVGVVGESGSGKSVTMLSLLKLIPMPPGEILAGSAHFEGTDLLSMTDPELKGVRGSQIGFVFQDPMTSLNPVLPIGDQIVEGLVVRKQGTAAERRARAVELLELVGIPSPRERLDAYPHELSGGMRQRVMIATALAGAPPLVIADEPTTALDVTIQAQIVELVGELRRKLGTSIVWITHDLGVVAGLADRIIVMYAGQIVEQGPVRDIFSRPQHPYTQGLLASVPRPDRRVDKLVSIRGRPPTLTAMPTSCPFAPRCDFVFDRCRQANPPTTTIGTDRQVACWWDTDRNVPREESSIDER